MKFIFQSTALMPETLVLCAGGKLVAVLVACP